jgi:dipeptidyl aminopeptidase/acylaminoacyl peptidase
MSKMKTLFTISCFIVLSLSNFAQKNISVPFEKWISLKQVGGVKLSPDGKNILYNVTSTQWNENGYDTEIWLSRNGQRPFQLTNTAKGSSNAGSFSPDNKWVSFLADRGNKTQIYLISIDGGEAFVITDEENGITSYAWSPNGDKIAITKTESESKKDKNLLGRYGAFSIEGEEYKLSHLWVLNFNLDSISNADLLPCYTSKSDSLHKNALNTCNALPKAVRMTEGDFTVSGFDWSPDGKQIAFNRQPNPLINSSIHSDIAIFNVENKTTKTIVKNPAGDFFQHWSPDGKSVLFTSTLNDTTTHYFKNNRVFIFNLDEGKSKEILSNVDENKSIYEWNPNGIVYGRSVKMKNKVFIYNPSTELTREMDTGMDVPGSVSLSKDGTMMAVSGRHFDQLNEIWYGKTGEIPKVVTNMTSQIKDWKVPVSEVISWKSKDGAEIEGVLIKPADYDSKKKYPLLMVIHGGPTGIDRPEPTPGSVYPISQWCEKGALVLRVNYRGSAGYGEKFRSLNFRNLGVGDMWDVMSGVEYLDSKGMIDTTKMGCMGWSQGGYISAFLTTNTNRFKAISVGAGISNWVTYYVNTDITPFTKQYLQSTPWSDMNIYLKTSPMTNINKASTPTLIQHGEFDRRVPIPNAYELYRGLQDRNIPSKLIVYKGFGHGINKPKERLAAIWHNWQWFNHYVFGDKMEYLPVED